MKRESATACSDVYVDSEKPDYQEKKLETFLTYPMHQVNIVR